MSFSRFLPLGLCLVVLCHACVAQLQPPHRQQHAPSECRIDRITAREPNRRVNSEAGFSEFWESDGNDELECAGVEAVRNTIQPKGLLLPFYANAPKLVYVIQGSGIFGTVLPGCPETFETSIQSEGDQGSGRKFFDKHQRVSRYKEGDILAFPAGLVHWIYNNGDTDVVMIVLRDTSNVANQLDQSFRAFFLAGNRHNQQGGSGSGSSHGSQRWDMPESSNIFNGFDDEILQEIFKVEAETVRQLKGENDKRGCIVRADTLVTVGPPYDIDEEQEQGRRSQPGRGDRGNGIEETMCSTWFRANIANPARADVFNPRGGRVASLNSQKLPILDLLQLSAERGVLYKNAVLAPHYNLNAHSIIYVISGSSRLQIVRNDGTAVFDDVVHEGQLIVVPQDFAVIKKATKEGFEWVAFKTNDNAITTQLAGRFSFIRALPEDVLMNSYDISRDQAKSLKYNRKEGVVFSPNSMSPRQKRMSALLNVMLS